MHAIKNDNTTYVVISAEKSDLSPREIAATLGGTPEAARANVYQALKKLRARLQEES